MNAIVINSQNNKTCDSHRLLLNVMDKINLKRSGKYVALSNLSIYYTWKKLKKKKHIKIIDLKYQLQDEIKSLNYLRNHILYQIFKVNLNRA